MKIFFKTILVLILLFVPIILGIFGVKKFFPEDYAIFQETTKTYFLKKFPFLAYLGEAKKRILQKKEIIEEKKQEPVEDVIDYFTNEFMYKAICTDKEPKNLKDKFIGCNRCPSYMNKKDPDYFTMKFAAQGYVIKKDEFEALVILKGCNEDHEETALVLRKGFGGWQRVSQFKNPVFFEEKPLIFYDKEEYLLLVGKRNSITEHEQKETLYSLSFRGNKIHTTDIFSSHSTNGLKCSEQFLAIMDTPIKNSEKEFSVQLNVMGWQEKINPICKIQSKKFHVNLKPDSYALTFKQKDNNFFGDKLSQKVMTELEKAQE